MLHASGHGDELLDLDLDVGVGKELPSSDCILTFTSKRLRPKF